MLAYVSSNWIVNYVGAGNWFAIPLAAIIGVPSYLNGYAAIPLISGLIKTGMTPGAAMAFITSGAVSSLPAAIAIWGFSKEDGIYSLFGSWVSRINSFSVGIPIMWWHHLTYAVNN